MHWYVSSMMCSAMVWGNPVVLQPDMAARSTLGCGGAKVSDRRDRHLRTCKSTLMEPRVQVKRGPLQSATAWCSICRWFVSGVFSASGGYDFQNTSSCLGHNHGQHGNIQSCLGYEGIHNGVTTLTRDTQESCLWGTIMWGIGDGYALSKWCQVICGHR